MICLHLFYIKKERILLPKFPNILKMVHSIGSKTCPHLVLSVVRMILNASFDLMLDDGLMFQELLVSIKKVRRPWIINVIFTYPLFFYPRLHI